MNCVVRQIELLQPNRKRKWVPIDPNQRFANIETIVAAVSQAAAKQAADAQNTIEQAAEASAAPATAATIESMMFEWQLPM